MKLRVLSANTGGERLVELSSSGAVLKAGRQRESDILLQDSSVSRIHAQFSSSEGRLFVEDLGSRGGTYVNDVRISGMVPVRLGDRVRIGTFRIELIEEEARAKAPQSPAASCRLERLAPPLLTWSVDGVESRETCFVNSVQVIANAPEGVVAILNPASGLLTETGMVQAVAMAEGKLASLPVRQSFARLDMLLPTDAEGLLGGGADDTWAFFTVPGEMSSSDQNALCEFLHPYSVDRKVFVRSTKLLPGSTYLVWVPGVDFSAAPTALRYASGTAAPVTESGWHLVPAGAQWVWDEPLHGFVPATDDRQPGFSQ